MAVTYKNDNVCIINLYTNILAYGIYISSNINAKEKAFSTN